MHIIPAVHQNNLGEKYQGTSIYMKVGMKKADDVMKYNHIEWTEWVEK